VSEAPPARCKRPESVLVVVYTRGGDVLLLERHTPPGWWQSVTGSLEPGETPYEAAVRELAEETGLAADGLVDLGISQRFRIAPAWRHRFAPGVAENLEHAFALELGAPCEIRIDPAEHERLAWLPFAEALGRATSTTNRAIIERLLRTRFGV
jgi:dihydroneopterin triphosphate diphosphatase